MSNNEFDGLKGKIDSKGIYNIKTKKRVSWSNVLGKHKVNNKNKMLIIYGMALHVATDTFAHSAYYLNGNRITHPDADKATNEKGKKENRQECAEQIAGKVLQHTYKGESGTTGDFCLSIYNTGKDKKKCFKLKWISRYIKEIDSNYYTRNKAYFDKMDVSSL